MIVLKKKQIIEDVIEEQVFDELVDTENLEDNQVWETIEGTRIAKGDGWELWADSLNYVFKFGSKSFYYSNFEAALNGIKDKRIKYWLLQKKWIDIDQALKEIHKEISDCCMNCEKSIKFLNNKYGLNS